MCVDVCADMCLDLCAPMCVDMCAGMCVDMCADMCVDMCAGMCEGMCVDMRSDMCLGTRIDNCIDMGILPRCANIRASFGISANPLTLGPFCSMRHVGTPRRKKPDRRFFFRAGGPLSAAPVRLACGPYVVGSPGRWKAGPNVCVTGE